MAPGWARPGWTTGFSRPPAPRWRPHSSRARRRGASTMTTTSPQAGAPDAPTTITDREREQIDRANASSATPVVFIHGLWLLPSSWDRWATLFEESGYIALTPDWPDDPATIEAARAEPEVLAKKSLEEVASHTTEVIKGLTRKPVLIGHSTGGLLAEMLAGRGLAAVTVAIDPGVFRGVLPLPFKVLKGVGPLLLDPRTPNR